MKVLLLLLVLVFIGSLCATTHIPDQVDNTVRESKNQTVMKLMSWLLVQKGLQLTGLIMSRVGHTHSTLGS